MSVDIQVGDLVEVRRGDCDSWSHDSHWAPDGKRGRVDGSWRGHPGGNGDHHIAVSFRDGNMEVASLVYSESELKLIRRGAHRRPLDGAS